MPDPAGCRRAAHDRPGSGPPPCAGPGNDPCPHRPGPLRRLRCRLFLAGRLAGRLYQVAGTAVQDVAQRREDGQAQPFRHAGDQPVDLLPGQSDPAGSQPRDHVGRGEHPRLGHQPPQVPLVGDGLPAHCCSPSPNARSSADRSIRFRASCPTVSGGVRYRNCLNAFSWRCVRLAGIGRHRSSGPTFPLRWPPGPVVPGAIGSARPVRTEAFSMRCVRGARPPR